MTNPDEIVVAVAAKLRLIPDLVTLCGGNTANIIAYTDTKRSLEEAAIETKMNSILVAFVESEAPQDTQATWVWVTQAYIKIAPGTSLGTVITTIMNATATGDSQKFTEAEFHPSFMQLGVPVVSREQDVQSADFLVMRQRWQER